MEIQGKRRQMSQTESDLIGSENAWYVVVSVKSSSTSLLIILIK